mgnify:CR=1 FL=1
MCSQSLQALTSGLPAKGFAGFHDRARRDDRGQDLNGRWLHVERVRESARESLTGATERRPLPVVLGAAREQRAA